MRQFDVFANPSARSRGRRPFLVKLQHDTIARLETVIVAPLAKPGDIALIERLFAEIEFKNAPYLLLATEMAPIPRSLLGKPLGTCAQHRDRIVAALDFLFTGV